MIVAQLAKRAMARNKGINFFIVIILWFT